jgi:hypothetical protein
VEQVVVERHGIPSGPACSWRKMSVQLQTRGYERLGAASACCERYRSIGVWDRDVLEGDDDPTNQVQQLGALVAGELENLKVAPLRPALASSDLTRWDVLQAGWPLWRRGMRYGQRRGTPGVTA